MLALSRKIQESVVVEGVNVGDRRIRAVVLEIRNGSVRLGFEAPEEVTVHRMEVSDRLQKNKPSVNGADRPAVQADAAESARPARFRRQP